MFVLSRINYHFVLKKYSDLLFNFAFYCNLILLYMYFLSDFSYFILDFYFLEIYSHFIKIGIIIIDVPLFTFYLMIPSIIKEISSPVFDKKIIGIPSLKIVSPFIFLMIYKVFPLAVIYIIILLFIFFIKKMYNMLFVTCSISCFIYFIGMSEIFRDIINISYITTEPFGRGYYSVQSIYSIVSGGWKGIGFGNVSMINFNSDEYILSVISQELGLFFSVIFLFLFIVFFLRLFKIAFNAPDKYGYYFVIFITFMWILRVIFNILTVIGFLREIHYVNIPFLGYTSNNQMLMDYLCMGIILNTSCYKTRLEE